MRLDQKSMNPTTGNKYPVRLVVQITDDMAAQIAGRILVNRQNVSEFVREAIEKALEGKG